MIYFLSSGGAERFVVDLSNELAKKGHDVTIMTLKDDSKDSKNRKFYCREIADNVKYLNLGIARSCASLYPEKFAVILMAFSFGISPFR